MTKANQATQPVKAGEVPQNVSPKVTFQAAMDVAATKIDALLRGGVECITFIAAAFLIGYLAKAGEKQKMSVMRDEFSLALGKKGLGGTQTKKYLDYAFKLAGEMYKDCKYGGEIADLIAASTPDKAHDAVKAYLSRVTKGKKTELGTPISDASVKLNVLGIHLGFEADPNTPEAGLEDAAVTAKRQEGQRKATASRIEKDPAILSQVPATTLASSLAKVVSFDVLIIKHIEHETKVDTLRAERDRVLAAYDARIKELGQSLPKRAKSGKVKSETVRKAA